jgi:hypothetical protein
MSGNPVPYHMLTRRHPAWPVRVAGIPPQRIVSHKSIPRANQIATSLHMQGEMGSRRRRAWGPAQWVQGRERGLLVHPSAPVCAPLSDARWRPVSIGSDGIPSGVADADPDGARRGQRRDQLEAEQVRPSRPQSIELVLPRPRANKTNRSPTRLGLGVTQCSSFRYMSALRVDSAQCHASSGKVPGASSGCCVHYRYTSSLHVRGRMIGYCARVAWLADMERVGLGKCREASCCVRY